MLIQIERLLQSNMVQTSVLEIFTVNKKEETFHVFQLLYVTLNTESHCKSIEIGPIYF